MAVHQYRGLSKSRGYPVALHQFYWSSVDRTAVLFKDIAVEMPASLLGLAGP